MKKRKYFDQEQQCMRKSLPFRLLTNRCPTYALIFIHLFLTSLRSHCVKNCCIELRSSVQKAKIISEVSRLYTPRMYLSKTRNTNIIFSSQGCIIIIWKKQFQHLYFNLNTSKYLLRMLDIYQFPG